MELVSGESWEQLIENNDTFLFDCDGVLWSGDTAIAGGTEAISLLKVRSKKIYFVTNNSTKSRLEYVDKFVKLGYPIELEQIFSTAFATGYYMRNVLKFKGKVYLLGKTGFKRELEQFGIQTSEVGPDPTTGGLAEWASIPLDPDITGVVAGFDENISFKKLTLAATYLSDPKCLFIATNEDNKLPTGTKVVLPGTGSLLAAVKYAAQREPLVIGKPHAPILQCLESITDIDRARTIMIGDKLSTDIAFGNRNGMKTVLTLSGVTSRQEMEQELANPQSECKPVYYTNSLVTLTN